MTNPSGNFIGQDPDYDLGKVNVQWADLGTGAAAKVHIIWESRQYVWDGVSAWVRGTQAGGGGGGTSSSFGATFPATGTAAGVKATAAAPTYTEGFMHALSTDLSGSLRVTTGASGGLTDAQLRASAVPVSLGAAVDVSDRAARLLGVIYGSQAQQVKQTATNFNLASELFVGATAIDPRDISDRVARLLGHVTVDNASLAVTGTFWQGTQPISAASLPLPTGASTETTLATRLADATFTGRINTQGQKTMALSTPVVLASDQSTVPVSMAAASVLFRGRAAIFRTPGRAGTTGQKIMSLHNATGSTIKVYVTKVAVDLMQTVVKLITVAPPVVRLWKVTVLPTNGTALTKNRIGGTTTSNASVTALQDASADGTNSATALTATLPAGTILTQEFAPRFITAAGYEPADRMEFDVEGEVELQALEGVVLFLDYTLATQNPITDMWVATIEWYEK